MGSHDFLETKVDMEKDSLEGIWDGQLTVSAF